MEEYVNLSGRQKDRLWEDIGIYGYGLLHKKASTRVVVNVQDILVVQKNEDGILGRVATELDTFIGKGKKEQGKTLLQKLMFWKH